MTPYWQQQHGLTTSEKAAFVERVQAEQAAFLASLRTVHSQAENRMLTRTAKEQHAEALRELNRGPDDVVPDADDSSVQRGMLT